MSKSGDQNIIAGIKQIAALAGSAQTTPKPGCGCRTCHPLTINDMRFVICPDCGNKRCPRANDHRNACTGSNELGQEGSAYPAAPIIRPLRAFLYEPSKDKE